MSKLRVVKIKGGLGNQMFQYAFVKALSLAHHSEGLIDISFYKTDIKRLKEGVTRHNYQLDNFNLSLEKISGEDLKKYYFNIPLINKIYEKHSYPGVYDKNLVKFRNGKKLYIGYFQTEKYFKEYREEILKDFELKTELNDANKNLLDKIKSTNAISLHVRRGDYVNLKEIHGLCTLEYYKKAIDYIVSKVKNPHFYLFSDDIPWVKENLKINYPCTTVDINSGDNGFFDLELMKNCKHNIIANSSFSWWGAWLNQNPDKIIVSPQKWFASDRLHTDDTICDDWIKI